MPIRPEQRDRYPDDWPQISNRIRFKRARGRCECHGECGRYHGRLGIYAGGDERCTRRHGQQIPGTAGQSTVLTVAHLNHVPEDCRDENLLAMCQACHLRYDADEHAANAKRTRLARETEGMEPLWPSGGGT